MNKIEELHLDIINHCLMYNEDFNEIEGKEYAASKSANITRQFAVEFSYWQQSLLGSKNDNWLINKTTQDLFEEFLKTK